MQSKRTCMHRLASIIAVLAAAAFPSAATDWPQYRGIDGVGISSEDIGLPRPDVKALWSTPTTTGFSSFAVASGKAFTLMTRDIEGAPRVMCVALDAASGQELWAVLTGVAIFPKGGDSGAEGNNGGDGPRS